MRKNKGRMMCAVRLSEGWWGGLQLAMVWTCDDNEDDFMKKIYEGRIEGGWPREDQLLVDQQSG